MTETNGSGERKEQRVFSSRSWMMGLLIIGLATWVLTEGLINGPGWISVMFFVYGAWQGRKYAERRLEP